MSAPATTHCFERRLVKSFLLERVQPAMTELVDGSLSTLAPISAVALVTQAPMCILGRNKPMVVR